MTSANIQYTEGEWAKALGEIQRAGCKLSGTATNDCDDEQQTSGLVIRFPGYSADRLTFGYIYSLLDTLINLKVRCLAYRDPMEGIDPYEIILIQLVTDHGKDSESTVKEGRTGREEGESQTQEG